jgi:hypothetical protein
MMNFSWTFYPLKIIYHKDYLPYNLFLKTREKKQSERCEKLKQMYESCPWNIEDENFKLVYA